MKMVVRLSLGFLVATAVGSAILGIRHYSTSEHDRMVYRLDQLREWMEARHASFGDDDLKRAERRIKTLDAATSDAPRLYVHQMIGEAKLRLGDPSAAAEHLEQAYELIKVNPVIPEYVKREARYNLAVAFLRSGEVENCVHCANGKSCIFPIAGEGVHSNPQGSTAALGYLEQVLEDEPNHLRARWLYNIAHMTLGSYPEGVPEQLRLPLALPEEESWFRNVALERGIAGDSLSGGAIVDDFDGDGDFDIVTSSWHPAGQIRFRRNVDGQRFVDDTERANLTGILGGLNLMHADYDNDGDLDILVLRGAWQAGEARRHPNSLLQNDGSDRFVDVTASSGLMVRNGPSQSAAWADYDNDGDLDLFVGNEAFPNQLFQNNGDGTFTDRAGSAGVSDPDGFCKSCAWGDYNGDRYPDLYVSNFGTPAAAGGAFSGNEFATQNGMPNRLYRNNRDGTFTDVAAELNVTQPFAGFTCWFWDYNNDGALDLFVASYSGDLTDYVADFLGNYHGAEGCCLYRGDGRGGFAEVAEKSELRHVNLTMGANFGDFDNDGFLDFYLGTGAPGYDSLTPNRMYHNRGGELFEDVTVSGGFGHLQKGHGIAFADFDGDGQQEIFAQFGGAYPGDLAPDALFACRQPTTNHWLKIDCRGVQSNSRGLGARIRAQFRDQGVTRTVYRWVSTGGAFGANPYQQHIGLGSATVVDELEVYWPTTDTRQRFTDVAADANLIVREGDPHLQRQPVIPASGKQGT